MAWIPVYRKANERATINAYAAALEIRPRFAGDLEVVGHGRDSRPRRDPAGTAADGSGKLGPLLARMRGWAPVADLKGREGFHAHRTAAGEHDIRLVFELPRGNKIGRVVSSLAIVTALALLIWE